MILNKLRKKAKQLFLLLIPGHYFTCPGTTILFILLSFGELQASQCIQKPLNSSERFNRQFITGEELRPGDIILGRSEGLIGVIMSTQGHSRGKYSHAALVYYEPELDSLQMINIRPKGMENCYPADYQSRYRRLALVRPNQEITAEESEKLTVFARDWLAEEAKSPFPPDLKLDMEDHSELFCLEIVAAIYKQLGRRNPFAATIPVTQIPVARIFLERMDLDIKEIPSPSAILDNPEFTALSHWTSADYDFADEALQETLVFHISDYLMQGDTIKSPKWLDRQKIRLLLKLYSYRVKAKKDSRVQLDIPELVGPRNIQDGYMLFQHIVKAKKRARRELQRESHPTPELAEEIAIQKLDALWSNYFTRHYCGQKKGQ